MSAVLSPNCPNCAWAIKEAARLKLPALTSWFLAIVAENVSRFTLEWKVSVATAARATRLSERKIRYIMADAAKTKEDGESGLFDALAVIRTGNYLTFKLNRKPANGAASEDVEAAHHAASEPEKPANGAGEAAHHAATEAAHHAGNPLKKESPKERKEEPLLRNGEPALPVAVEPAPKWTPSWWEETPPAASQVPAVTEAEPPPDPRKQLFSEGKLILRKAIGTLASDCGGVIVRLIKTAEGDCGVVLATLRTAAEQGLPADGFIAWVTNGIKARLSKEPRFRHAGVKLAYEQGLLRPEHRKKFQSELTPDTSGFMQEAADAV
jgi:hypothetical protein